MTDGQPEPEPAFRLFSLKKKWWFAILNFIFNKLGAYFLNAMFFGFADALAFWKPLLDYQDLAYFIADGRINGKKLKFDCPRGTYFCQWIKLKLLNFITFTLYGSCCGGQKKFNIFIDSKISFEDGSPGEFVYFGAQVPGWVNFLYLFGCLLSMFIARPYLMLWEKKRFMSRARFGGYELDLSGCKYSTFAKIYYCQCGMFCAGKLNVYLDSGMKPVQTTSVSDVMGKLGFKKDDGKEMEKKDTPQS